ncbi:BTB/POZ domain-containing protein kctd6 [Rhizophlyctis rosea]|nr:BTB/POZ domain-containing protein kctd6 [Rhizophlyctis rosea]
MATPPTQPSASAPAIPPTPTPQPQPPSRIRLSVGGHIFETTHTTIKSQPDSMLARMFDPFNAQNLHPNTDGSIFIDRNPTLFEPILEFYRTGELELPKDMSKEALMREVDFYLLAEAVEAAGGVTDGYDYAQENGGRTWRERFGVTLNTSGDAYGVGLRDLAQQAIPVLHTAFKEKIFPFAMTISTIGSHDGVPDLLLQTPTAHRFWRDFANALSTLHSTSFLKDFSKLVQDLITPGHLRNLPYRSILHVDCKPVLEYEDGILPKCAYETERPRWNSIPTAAITLKFFSGWSLEWRLTVVKDTTDASASSSLSSSVFDVR